MKKVQRQPNIIFLQANSTCFIDKNLICVMKTILVLMFLSVTISSEIRVYACMTEATCHSVEFLPFQTFWVF